MFIISEISPQFGGDLDLAEQMILQSNIVELTRLNYNYIHMICLKGRMVFQ